MSDPYLQANGTLKNRLGLTDLVQLRKVEYDLTRSREREFLTGEVQIPQTFDQAHLQAIHRHIFHDVYEWAGVMRHQPVVLEGQQVQLGPLLQKGSDVFLPAPNIPMALGQLAQQIAEDTGLQSPKRLEFAAGAAQILGDLNVVHPFREGNGRTQRQFMRDLATRAGYTLDFSVLSQERNIMVSQASNRGDLEPTRRMLEEISDSKQVAALREAIRFMDSQQIDWNNRYLAAAAYGHEHQATLVARSPNFALLMEGRGEGLKLVVTYPEQLSITAELGKEVQFRAKSLEQTHRQGLEP